MSPAGWLVIVTGSKLVEEVRHAPEEKLSSPVAAYKFLQGDYTIGRDTFENPFHVTVVRSQLTRNLANKFNEMREELIAAFEDCIPCKGSGKLEVLQLPLHCVFITTFPQIGWRFQRRRRFRTSYAEQAIACLLGCLTVRPSPLYSQTLILTSPRP